MKKKKQNHSIIDNPHMEVILEHVFLGIKKNEKLSELTRRNEKRR